MGEDKDSNFIIGNAGEEFIESHQSPDGIGHDGEWFVKVDKVAISAYRSLLIGEDLKKLEELVNNPEVGSLESLLKNIGKSPKKRFEKKLNKDRRIESSEEELIEEFIIELGSVVLKELSHAYGTFSHDLNLIVEYEKGEEEELLKACEQYKGIRKGHFKRGEKHLVIFKPEDKEECNELIEGLNSRGLEVRGGAEYNSKTQNMFREIVGDEIGSGNY